MHHRQFNFNALQTLKFYIGMPFAHTRELIKGKNIENKSLTKSITNDVCR